MKDYRRIVFTRMEEDGYPQEAKQALREDWDKVEGCPAALRRLDSTVRMYECGMEKLFRHILRQGKRMSEMAGVDERAGMLLLFLAMSEAVHEKYRKKGYPEEMFSGIIADFKWKLTECHDQAGLWGVIPFEWYERLFDLTLFAMGRLQYEMIYAPTDYEKAGLLKGDPVVNVHIPSSGPLKVEEVMASFRQAEAFFAPYFQGPVVFVCQSWLLAPYHKEILKPESNIRRFGECFDVVESHFDNWGCITRIFNRPYEGKAEELEEDTSLRRAYKQYLLDGGETCYGIGYLMLEEKK